MPDDMVDLTPNAGTGGMGDGGGGDETFEGANEALDVGRWDGVQVNDGGDAVDLDGGDEGDGQADDGPWYADMPEHLHDALSKFSGPDALAESYAAQERRMGEMRGDIGSLRDEIANLAAGQSRGPDGQGYGSEPQNQVPTMQHVAGFAQEIAQRMDAGDIDVGRGMAEVMAAVAGVSEAREALMQQRFEELMGERTAPLEQANFRTQVAREIQSLKTEVGEETYKTLEPEVKATLRQWEQQQPGFIQNARAVRAAFGEVYLRSQAAQRREAGARVLDRTARGKQRGPTPAQQIIDEMDALNPTGLSGGL